MVEEEFVKIKKNIKILKNMANIKFSVDVKV